MVECCLRGSDAAQARGVVYLLRVISTTHWYHIVRWTLLL